MSIMEMNPLVGGSGGGVGDDDDNPLRRLHHDDDFDPEEDISSRYHRVDSFDLAETASLTSPQRVSAGALLHIGHDGDGDSTNKLRLDHNLDVLFRQLYDYYHARGFSPALLQHVFQILQVFFTLFIGALLVWCLDWRELHKCFLDSTKCGTFAAYVHVQALHRTLIVLSVCWLLPRLVQLVRRVWVNAGLRRLFLLSQVSSRDLQTMHWSTVVTHLRDLQHRVFFVKNGMQVNALHLAMRIMRVDNYKILVYSSRILPLGSPSLSESFKPSTSTWYMGRLLERNLDYAFFTSGIIDPNTFTLKLRADPQQSVRQINFQLNCLAVVNLVLLPVILVWTLGAFFFQYADEYHSKRNYLGPRYLTPHACWLVREYNELPHQFEKRSAQGVKSGDRYLRPFINPVLVECARGLTFCLGGVAAVLLLLGLVDDSVLVRVTLWDRNLLWFFAILTSATAALRAMVPPQEDMDLLPSNNPNLLMRRVASFTHVLPDHWRGRANTYAVKEAFEGLVPNRVVLLVRELLSACVNWYILAIVLPRHTDDLVRFVSQHTQYVDGVGEVCTESLLQVSVHGDAKWPILLDTSHTSHASNKRVPLPFPSDLSSCASSPNVLVESKLEKSYLQFKISYAAGICGVADRVGDELLARIRALQQRGSRVEAISSSSSSSPPLQPPPQPPLDAAMMSASLMSVLDQYHVVVAAEDDAVEDALLGGVGEDVFWALEQWRDEEMKRRQGGEGGGATRRRVTQ